MSAPSLPLTTRLWFAFVCALRVLFDGRFAWRMWSVRDALPAPAEEPKKTKKPQRKPEPKTPEPPREPPTGEAAAPALVLLGILQREGRLVDFLEQDITSFDDSEVGVAARVVHEGCRKALHAHGKVRPIRSEEEETSIEVARGIDTGEVKLTGKVAGKPPYQGVLRHRGWRIEELKLPTPTAGHDPAVVAPAEVEL